ncbi:MAG: ribulose-phosphate 3-epimerase [Bacteroidetes bacterium]|nr:ribulose-phosphate 3-epimerase [Bacteroidota bacterium]
MAILAPSFLASDFLHLEKTCKMIDESTADWCHLDVMDGRFVPNISFGIPIIEHIRRATKKICDVHLMILDPGDYASAFQKAGADILSIHLEACPNLHRNIQQIKELGMKASVAINPHTPVSMLQDVLGDIDMVCMMSVNPGFGGQKFIPHTLEKVKELRRIIDEKNYPVIIEVDGGVTLENAPSILAAGADALVAGSSIFNTKDPLATITAFKNL